jgi:imidazolonepropionase-like amidohydrolase
MGSAEQRGMTSKSKLYGLVLIALLVSACTQKAATVTGDFALVGANVITMASPGEVLANQNIVVTAGIITSIHPSGGMVLDPAVQVIDAQGKYVLPGLADMHVHLGSANELPLYTANGVTLIRNMWGDEGTLTLRQQTANREIPGPRIITAGPIVDGAPRVWPGSEEVVTVEDAGRVVAEQRAAGYDFIKVYSRMSLEVFDAVAAAAKANDIPFAGHVPLAVPVDYAMRSGMSTIEHLYGFKKVTVRDGVSIGESILAPEKIQLGRQVLSGEISAADIFDEDKLATLAKLAATTGIWSVPTLIVQRNLFITRAEVDAQFSRLETRYLPKPLLEFWNPENDFRRKKFSENDFAAMQTFFEGELQRVNALHAAGARILAGTDVSNPFVFPGFSLHEELALLVRAGLTPYEALQTATSNVAEFLDEAGEFGHVVVGQRADLLVLSENPLVDIRNTTSIVGVVNHGSWIADHEILQMLADVAAGIMAPPDEVGDEQPE